MKEFWQTALWAPLAALGQKVIALLPNVLAMMIIVTVGLVAGRVIAYATERLLRVIGLDHLGNRLGVSAALARGGVKADPSHLVGRAAYWMVVLFAAMAGLGALNLEPVNQFARSLLAYLPHLFVASLILVVGYLLSNFVSQAVLIAAVNAGMPPARLIAAFSRWGIQIVAMAMALEQLGIAQHTVAVGFGLVLGGLVLTLSLAFGLGAKDLAREFLDRQFGRKSERTKDDLTHL
jgi:hypothetical protein